MQIKSIKLQNIRNIEFASIEFDGRNHFLLGSNAQGKTNLIESIGFISALRSFRTQEANHLIRKGFKEAQICVELSHELMGDSEVLIKLLQKSKEIHLDGEKMTRMSDFIGLFPTVTISSQDIQLLRSSPQHRRRFLDITISTVDKEYFKRLKNHHRILKNRNSLLKQCGCVAESLNAFDKLLAENAFYLTQVRRTIIAEIGVIFKELYEKISQTDEVSCLSYEPNVKASSVEEYYELLLNNRERDEIMKSTQRGPHRDDFSFQINDSRARSFSSEGQQKNLVIALKLAQMNFYSQKLSIKPILLADDILGELDEGRREGFWNTMRGDVQVIATGVDLPQKNYINGWGIIGVSQGVFEGKD